MDSIKNNQNNNVQSSNQNNRSHALEIDSSNDSDEFIPQKGGNENPPSLKEIYNQQKMTTKIKHPTSNKKLIDWVNRMERLCKPDDIVWINGSDEQKKQLEKEALSTGELIQLNQEKLPGCFLHRTAVDDVVPA